MPRLWARIMKKQRVERQQTVDCAWDEVEEGLTRLCHEMDIPRPLWLNKHYREMNDFRRTHFLPEHFMESVPFDRMEIEYLEDDDHSRRSKDPRNQFDGF